MKSNRFLWVLGDVHSRLLSMLFRDAAPSGENCAREQSLVAALCICVLGEGGRREGGNWPPLSIDSLMRNVDRTGNALVFGLCYSELMCLLEEGLVALDEAVRYDTSLPFHLVGRAAQLRALYRVESGRTDLSRPRAAAFVDAFLTLAAQAYLRDALDAPLQ